MTLYAALPAFAALAFLCQVHCFLFDFIMSLNYSVMKFLGSVKNRVSNNWPNESSGKNVYKTLKSCW